MSATLVINEIYLSLQGESTFAGLPCVFIRLTACNLRCSYCDTAYAFAEGQKQTFDQVRCKVSELARPYAGQTAGPKMALIEFTGRRALLQPNVLPLMKNLCDDGYTVLLET